MSPPTTLCRSPSFGVNPISIGTSSRTIQVRGKFVLKGGGVLHSFSDWISLQTNQMTPPTILCCSPSFGLNPISTGPRNRTIQVRSKFVQKWRSWCIA
ncbi:unnamed protein product [Prunus armeniaca]